ncbi:hypothetical protein [Curtobacterium sp. KT1]|uniref:hypothetical protein n=1 Tax=Curtobacterium sp. KT1 TaxID=3372858 RepID=UPI0037C0DFE7
MTEILTLDAAARRIRRSIEQWVARGMDTILHEGRRYVLLSVLVQYAATHGRRRGRARDAP